MKQQNTQYFAGLVRQCEAKVRRTSGSTELSNKSSVSLQVLGELFKNLGKRMIMCNKHMNKSREGIF